MRKLLLIPLLFAASACDGGSGPSGSAELTSAEAAQLARAMFGMASGLASSGLNAGSFNVGPAAQNTFTVPIQETIPCDPSGNVKLSGTVTAGFDDISTGFSMSADISAAPAACAHRLENGDIIKVTGDPDLDIEVSMASDAEGLTQLQVTETGAFTWTRGGASGRCTVNLSSSLNAATQMVTVSGTFCGFPVNETFPIDER